MNFTAVTDIHNIALKLYHQFRENAFREDGSFIADSPKVVNLLLEEGIEVKSILATQTYYDEFSELVSRQKDVKVIIRTLKENGYRIYAAEVKENSTPLSKVKPTEKWVLLMGHEGSGLSEKVLALCDEVVTIEMMEGVKSFNVGIAASIMMYTFKHSQ